MSRTPLVRPSDAPPTAHEADVATEQGPVGTTPLKELGTDVPRHVAIIMDGNRRWARQRGLDELEGHPAGVEAIRTVLRHARRRGIRALTLYAFSRENWARSDDEVEGLFGLLEAAIRNETEELRAQGVRVRMIGRMDELPEATRASIADALDATSSGTEMLLTIAFNYAGRTELVDAIRRIVTSGIEAHDIDEAVVAGALYTAGMPDPDLVIRTGGEVYQPRSGKLMPPKPLDAEPVDHPLDRRMALAQWMTSPTNPAFARATVNRYVSNLLGRGLVEPVDDLRATNPPTNPAMLQTLSDEFVKGGFNLKQLIRTIMISRLYQLDSQPTPQNLADFMLFREAAQSHAPEPAVVR